MPPVPAPEPAPPPIPSFCDLHLCNPGDKTAGKTDDVSPYPMISFQESSQHTVRCDDPAKCDSVYKTNVDGCKCKMDPIPGVWYCSNDSVGPSGADWPQCNDLTTASECKAATIHTKGDNSNPCTINIIDGTCQYVGIPCAFRDDRGDGGLPAGCYWHKLWEEENSDYPPNPEHKCWSEAS